jgi:protein-tyrosine phosphatase
LPSSPLPNSYWLLPGRVLAGEHPGGPSTQVTRERLSKLTAAGVSSFIDLTQPREVTAYDGLLPKGVDYLRWPIQDHGVPSDRAQVESLLAYIRHALDAGKVIYLHCRAGIGRTGTVMGCFLIEQGLDGPAALKQLNQLWRQSERSSSWPEVPQTPEQVEYVLRWARQRQLETEAPRPRG